MYRHSSYFDVSVCFTENGVVEEGHVQCTEKANVERMKVRLDGHAFQHEVLRHPFPELIVVAQSFFEFFSLERSRTGEPQEVKGRSTHLDLKVGKG